VTEERVERWRLMSVMAVRFVVLLLLSVMLWQVVTLRAEVRRLRSEMPEDHTDEIAELHDAIDELKQRVDANEAATEEATEAASDAQAAVDNLRNEVIALGLAQLR
jgi:hypothetical protein